MENTKLFLHGSYIGTTGYNQHTRDFVRHLSDLTNIKVRNYTIGKTWSGMSDSPHDNEPYFNDTDKKVLYEQILNTPRGRENFKMYSDESKEFNPDLHIVLCETNHHIFYDNYKGPRIAYNVWESTLLPKDFFNRLSYFDEFWVPSKWQKECTVKQGYPEEKIRVVPEGVDVHTFFPEDVKCEYTSDGRFKFFLAGRWDYRKSTKEIINAFLETFDSNEPVDLIVSVDNPFSNDGLNSTEERLDHYNFTDSRIKVLHFPPRDEYINLLKSSNVFLSCSRSEGWNLPLIESMACGIPSIYSNCSGQLEFAEGRGLPVKISHESPVSASTYNHYNNGVGNYYEPDFEDLKVVMRDAYENYTRHKDKAINDSKEIRDTFSWENVAKIGMSTVEDFMSRKPWLKRNVKPNRINISYINGPKVEILGDDEMDYEVEFIDSETNELMHKSTISNNMWTSCGREYYTKWLIKINGEVYDTFDVSGNRVLISLDSSSIGDTIAWTPYAVEFAKKHNCKVVLSTFHNNWFKDNPEYSDIEFINPGQSTPCYASYKIGWFRNNNTNKWDDHSLNPIPPNTQELQKTATDILGLDFKELNLGIHFTPSEKPPYISEYVVICPESTAGCKEWPYDSWVKLSEMLRKLGYSVVTLTKKKYNIKGNINIYNRNLNESINLLYHAKFMVGISSGLSWINWSLNKHTFLISGFTPKHHEFTTNVTRIINEHACNSCWSNTNFSFDAGDWDWCPIWKGTDKQHICQKSISPISVYKEIENYLQ